MEKVYIIVLNYNGWKDTLECLESLFKLDTEEFEVVLVDNCSSDESVRMIKEWAQGTYCPVFGKNKLVENWVGPLAGKPISYALYQQEDVEQGKISGRGVSSRGGNGFTFIQARNNLGFAGGNNVGLKYVLARNDAGHVWILNNDTVAEKTSLSFLLEQARAYQRKNRRVGMIAGKVFFYDRPQVIQGFGGRYNKWLAIGRHVGAFEEDHGQYDDEEMRFDYVPGSAMLVSTDFIRDVGLMSEEYFLYFEEMDWTLRGRKRGWEIGYCPKSRIYHKEGASAGTSQKGQERSALSDYYGMRNRIVFTRKFYPAALLTVYLSFLVVIYNRIRRGQYGRLKLVWQALCNKWETGYHISNLYK
ncbi:MAG: glycosyltransferase family 2 protein [Candidatus Omnitrophota bacterium]